MGTTTLCCFILAWTYAFVFGTVLVSVFFTTVMSCFVCLAFFGPTAGARSALAFFCSYELTEDLPWLWICVLWGSGGCRVRVAGPGFLVGVVCCLGSHAGLSVAS
jgi:hypothetical protein